MSDLERILDSGGYYDYQGREITMREWAVLIEEKRAHPDGYWRVGHRERGDVIVSTVWIGIDLGFHIGGPPIIYETMVFGGEYDQDTVRYATRYEAQVGHLAMCRKVFAE